MAKFHGFGGVGHTRSASWRIVRTALHLRQRDVADKAGISQARYSLLERGEVAPTDLEERKINNALQLSPQVRQALAEAVELRSRTSE
jgi:transcriptional regulator with XRE-family HTH domain